MLGDPAPYDRIPYFFTDQYDLGMEYSGWVPPDAPVEVTVRGETSIVDGHAPAFVALWTADGRVLAGMNVNVWDVNERIQDLVRRGLAGERPDPGELDALG